MSSTSVSHPFSFSGEFCGFIRTIRGKKRMVLRDGHEDHFLKVPKKLRHHLEGTLAVGSKITVTGTEVLDEPERGPKLVVSHIELLIGTGAHVPVCCPIRVCAKKNCWRNGGKQLFQALEESIAQCGLTGAVQVEAVGCLDHCKRGPNAEWQGHDFHHCTPADAEKILEAVQQRKGKETSTH